MCIFSLFFSFHFVLLSTERKCLSVVKKYSPDEVFSFLFRRDDDKMINKATCAGFRFGH